MESMNTASFKGNLTLDSFSKIIGEKWSMSPNILKNYILINVSMAITRNHEMKKEINKLYNKNRFIYYDAVKNSSCKDHVIMSEGTLEQEIHARKALGILLAGEIDYNLRNTIIKLLRKYYPHVFNAVKKRDKKELALRYLKMDEVATKSVARLESAVYFYFGVYRSSDLVDQGFFVSIINDVKAFEFFDPINADISKELDAHKVKIQELKALLKRKYGKIENYKDILISDFDIFHEIGGVLKNIFTINKININTLLLDANFINIDEILLAYIKNGNEPSDSKELLQTVINGIFLKLLIKDYKHSRSLYFENNEDALQWKIDSLEKKLNVSEMENQSLLNELTTLKEKNSKFNYTMNYQINDILRNHNSEIEELKNTIKNLENQLSEEKNYRKELDILREYIFKKADDYTPSDSEKNLSDYLIGKKVVIIGGTKEWRRKLRIKYPELRTLNGFNENFDTNILADYDYIFFYTGFMNHATYYRSMKFIRTNQIEFGYLGKTNMELVEDELIGELQKNTIKNFRRKTTK